MKKSLLLPLAILSGFILKAQDQRTSSGIPATPQKGIMEHTGTILQSTPSVPGIPMEKKVVNPAPSTQAAGISIIPIGKESNAFGTIGNRQHLWADPSIHSITLTHRVNPFGNSGMVAYDVSKMNGHNGSWMTNMPVYTPDGDPQGPHFSTARYPQGCIFNPVGNTNPDSAYEVFYCPTRDNTNQNPATNPAGDWGGHGYGSQHLGGLDTMQRQIHSSGASNSGWRFIPDGMFITEQGVVYNLDINAPGANGYNMNDSLLLSKGVFNTTLMHFDFTTTKLPFHTLKTPGVSKPMFSDCKIVFADDGQTGYISATARQSYTSTLDSSAFQLVVIKTTDGGMTWGAPVTIDVNAADPFLMNDGVSKYGAGFEHDVVVDANKNLHIIVNINMWNPSTTPQASFTYYAAYKPNMLGIFDVHTPDGGLTWKFRLLGKPNVFEGNFGVSPTDATNPQIGEYNRPQASRTYTNGNKVFFTWFDTDTTTGINAASAGNVSPDVWSIGYDITSKKWTPAKNFTKGSAADGLVRQGMVSYYVFDSAGIYTIPVAFVGFPGNDPTKSGVQEQLNYIDGITFKDADFTDTTSGVAFGIQDLKGYQNNNLAISQNYPNPFSNQTNIDVQLKNGTDLSLEVTDMLGQVIYSEQHKSVTAGMHTFTLDGSAWSSGIYFYTVRTTDSQLTRKMSVK